VKAVESQPGRLVRAPADIAGPVGSPPILLVHAMALTRRMWAPQLQALAARYRVIAPDLPGHGELQGMSFTTSRAVEVVRDLIDREAGGRALLVGLSLGGYVGLEVAARWPGKVVGLVLASCSTLLPPTLSRLSGATALLMRTPIERGLCAVQAWAFRRRLAPSLARVLIDAGLYFRALPDVARHIPNLSVLRTVRDYPGPILLLNGERDSRFRRDEGRLLEAARDARLVVLRGAGHLCNLDRPGEFTRAVDEFAEAIGWAGPRRSGRGGIQSHLATAGP
jgi:pimeloyl-ACP methyl ester carboxylesterase